MGDDRDAISTVAGAILAGGLARRLGGRDKALVPLAGRPLLAHAQARLAAQATPLVLNANGDPARFSRFALPVVADPLDGHPGPLAGVLAALEWAARAGHTRIVTVAVDTPFFPADLVARLAAAAASAPQGLAIAATRDGDGAVRAHPTFGLWPVTLRGPLAEALAGGVRKMRAFTEAEGAALALFADDEAFFNINAPADLGAAEARLAAATGGSQAS